VLKTRLASAAIMVPLVVGGVLYLPTAGVALTLALVMSVGLWEWGAMIPLDSIAARIAYPAGVAALMALAWTAPLDRVLVPLLLLAVIWWLTALYWLVRPGFGEQSTPAARVLKGCADHGPLITLALLVMVWLADSGAYFAGRRWGRTRLAPVISPGKTWEGVLGGIVTSAIAVLLAGYWYSRSLEWTLTLVPVALLAVMFSVVGDLLESLMKRQVGIKDSGSIIPGHGGVLDRIDSLTAAAPMFLAGMLWFGL
jgi:phosphatidate cytidylyltransferase